MVSSVAALTGFASSVSRFAAHSARALLVNDPMATSACPSDFSTDSSPEARSSRANELPAESSTSIRTTLPRKNTMICRAVEGPGCAEL